MSAWHKPGLAFEPLVRQFQPTVPSNNALEQRIYQNEFQTFDGRYSLRVHDTHSGECRGARFLSTSSSLAPVSISTSCCNIMLNAYELPDAINAGAGRE